MSQISPTALRVVPGDEYTVQPDMTTSDPDSPARKRKLGWYDYSLRSLLLLMLLICLVMSWAGPKVWQRMEEEARREMAGAEWLRGQQMAAKLGGSLCCQTPWAPGTAYLFDFRNTFRTTTCGNSGVSQK